MKLKHTPGPWIAKEEEVGRQYIRIRGTVLGGKYKIANVLHAGDVFHIFKETQEVRANARLIAAAPEMLDALIKTLKRGMNGLEQTRDEAIKIKNIIESATGLTIEEVLK